jgi:hypothetical protein
MPAKIHRIAALALGTTAALASATAGSQADRFIDDHVVIEHEIIIEDGADGAASIAPGPAPADEILVDDTIDAAPVIVDDGVAIDAGVTPPGGSDDIVIEAPVAADETPVIEPGPAAGGEIVIDDGIDAAPIIVDDGVTPPGGSDDIVIEAPVTADETPVIEPGPAAGGEIVIDDGIDAAPVVVDDALQTESERAPGEAADDIVIDPPAMGTTASAKQPLVDEGRLDLRVDDLWFEYGRFPDADAASDDSVYGKVSAVANWRPTPDWELQLSGRIDGYHEHGDDPFTRVRADYGDSYVSYRNGGTRLTAGTQTVIWGRLDEIPLSDRVSTADLSRFVLDDLADRRRSSPAVRAETAVAGGTLDLVWLVDFRRAELPDQDSTWYPIDTKRGRIIGFDPADIPPAAVVGASVIEDAPDGDGGFGARYTTNSAFGDFGVTVARTRQSIPYFRAAGPGLFVAEYPRSWAVGADAAVDAAGVTWRVEALYSSDNPVTRRDGRYTTTEAISVGGGAEFFPGDGDTRVNLQLVGMNMFNAPSVLDRSETYAFNGEVEVPFDRDRWRVSVAFNLGLDATDVYLNPKVTFLGWEPHEIYAAVHLFDGDADTFGGFHEDHSSLNLGWRSSF